MNTTDAADSTTLLLGHGGSWWDFWMIVSLGAVAFAGVFVVVFTAGSVIVHKREAASASDALERYKLETAGKVAEATTAGIAAGEKAGHAQAGVDAAQVEIERQKTLTANAQLETERLKKQLAWRMISAEEEAKLLSAISAGSFASLRIGIMAISNDAESMEYADVLVKALRKAGLSVDDPGVGMFVGRIPMGVFIQVRDATGRPATAAGILQKALKRAGVDAPGELNPQLSEDGINILVGVKPHPSAVTK